jgi:hypothetical protein
MMTRSTNLLTLLFCAITVTATAAEVPIWDTLTPGQQRQLSDGKAVVLEEEVSGRPWPRFTIYHLVNDTPRNVAAAFWDCETDATYIPNCTAVKILSQPHPWEHTARYTLKMPFFLPDEIYVTRDVLRNPLPSVYEVSWKVLESRYTKSCSGSLRIEPQGNGSILRYSNLVEPGSKFARMLRAKAGSQVLGTVQALVKQVEHELSKTPGMLELEVQALDRALRDAISPTASPTPSQ